MKIQFFLSQDEIAKELLEAIKNKFLPYELAATDGTIGFLREDVGGRITAEIEVIIDDSCGTV